MKSTAIIFLSAILAANCQSSIHLENYVASNLDVNVTPNGLNLTLTQMGVVKLSAVLGINLNVSSTINCLGVANCYIIDNDIKFHVTTTENNGYRIIWTSTNLNRTFTDCYSLNGANVQWYGGAQRRNQQYPVQNIVMEDFPYTIKEDGWTAIAEPYWLNSLGAYIYVDDKVPLFVDQNSFREDSICLTAKLQLPYSNRPRVLLQYTLVAADNPGIAHGNAVDTFLGRPAGPPDSHMIARPIWSTWANYKEGINGDVVLDYAEQIVEHGFADGQLVIDDMWETCHGSLAFDPRRFSQPNVTVARLKELGFVVSLWVHPFVDVACLESSQIGVNNGFFVRNTTGSTLMKWWNSDEDSARIVDFTNVEAREWYADRLRRLRDDYGIDAFKFDGGEGLFCPTSPVLYGDVEHNPASFTKAYVDMAASFGPFIEVRTGFRSQNHYHFVRMLDKDSVWDSNNGLYTLITTLLTFNLNGYTIVLPDMIGGNGYGGPPTPELFIRWVQANTFMPAMQFSYLPWDFDTDEYNVTAITLKYVALHETFANFIWYRIYDSAIDGSPVNPPIWWIDPTNQDALAEDTEYMLGVDVVVAPVVMEGAVSRDVVLPVGTWVDGNDGTIYEGPITIVDYRAPIDVLPYFVRNGTVINIDDVDDDDVPEMYMVK